MELNFSTGTHNALITQMQKKLIQKKIAHNKRTKKPFDNLSQNIGALKQKTGLMSQGEFETEASDSSAQHNLVNVGYKGKNTKQEPRAQKYKEYKPRSFEEGDKTIKSIAKKKSTLDKSRPKVATSRELISADTNPEVMHDYDGMDMEDSEESETRESQNPQNRGTNFKKKSSKAVEQGYVVQGEPETFSEQFLNKFLNLDVLEENGKMAQESFDPEKTPMTTIRFDDPSVGLHPVLLKSLLKMKDHTHFTKIQHNLIGHILRHNNCLIRSTTGSGKTLAYLIPIYHTLLRLKHGDESIKEDAIGRIPAVGTFENRSSGVQAIVIVPTRELAL